MPNPNVTLSPEMSLPIPDLTDPGPDYANNVNAALLTIDGHTHTGAPTDGLQLDLSKMLCAGDPQLNDNNLGTVRSVELVNQPADLIGSQDVNCLCVVNNILGFNNSAGTFVPLIGAPAANFTNWSIVNVTTNHVILPTDTYNVIQVFGSAPVTMTLPVAGAITPTAAGRLYLFKDISGAAATNPITIQVASGSGNVFAASGGTSVTIASNYGYMALYTDGASVWYVWSQNTYSTGDILRIESGAILDVQAGGNVVLETGSQITIQDANVIFQASNVSGTFAATALEVTSGYLQVDAAVILGINAPITAESGNAVNLGVANVTIAATGTTVLTAAQYNQPIINLSQSLSGNATVQLPNIPGAVFFLNCVGVTLNGHSLSVAVGTQTTALATTGTVNYGTTPSSFFGNWIIVTATNTFLVK
jgi:hypothetical protein